MVLIFQYLIAIVIIIGGLWVASLFVDIHPDGYKDMICSFTFPYAIGIIVYYVYLQLQIRKENQLSEKIQKRNS